MDLSSMMRVFMYACLIALTRQQAFITESQEQQIKDDELQRKIMSNFKAIVEEVATSTTNALVERLTKTFDSQLIELSAEVALLSGQADEVKQALRTMTGDGPSLRCPATRQGVADYVMFGKFCFLFIEVKKDWYAAEAACADMDAYLVKPDTPEINGFLKSEIRSRGGKSRWAGGHDFTTENQWRWDDTGDIITSSAADWHHGEPNNWGSGQDCLAIGHGSTRQWDDASCDYKSSYICQTPVIKDGGK